MNEQSLAVLKQLADKLGTTIEYLWGALLKQAPIHATIDLIGVLVVLCAATVWTLVVRNKTKERPHPRYPDDRDRTITEWSHEGAVIGWAGAVVMWLLLFGVVMENLPMILAGYFNPEYWALMQVV